MHSSITYKRIDCGCLHSQFVLLLVFSKNEASEKTPSFPIHFCVSMKYTAIWCMQWQIASNQNRYVRYLQFGFCLNRMNITDEIIDRFETEKRNFRPSVGQQRKATKKRGNDDYLVALTILSMKIDISECIACIRISTLMLQISASTSIRGDDVLNCANSEIHSFLGIR